MMRPRGVALVVVVAALVAPCGVRAQPSRDPDPWWGPDKALHLGVSAAISGVGYGVSALFTDARPLRLLVGGSAGLLAGALKELLDLAGLGTPSWRDLTWDVIGAVTGAIVALVVDVLIIRPLVEPTPHPG